MFAVGEALGQIRDQTERNVIAGTIFGESQSGLHVLLTQTKDIMADLFKQSDELGNTLSSFDAKRVEAAADSIGAMTTSFNGFSRELTTTAGPAITQILNELTAALDRLNGEADEDPSAINRGLTMGDVIAGAIKTASETTMAFRGEKGDFTKAIDPTRFWRTISELSDKRVQSEVDIRADLNKRELEKQTMILGNMLNRMPEERNRPIPRIPTRIER